MSANARTGIGSDIILGAHVVLTKDGPARIIAKEVDYARPKGGGGGL